jgi:hypothetical protein
MDLGKFKRVDFDDDDAMPEWLREDVPTKEENKPFLQTQPTQKTQPKVKSTEGFLSSKVKLPPYADSALPSAQKSGEQARPMVSIQIHIPHFRPPKIAALPWHKLRPWLIACVAILLLLVGGKWAQSRVSKSKNTPQKAPVIVSADLGYKPLVPPANSDTAQTAAIPKPAYDQQRHFYTFNDIYKGANVTVDQQAVPTKLKGSDTEVKKLAASIGATDSFTTTLGKVYIVTSKESGTQRLVLTNEKMLMFIQSTKTVSNADWVTYIQNLQ